MSKSVVGLFSSMSEAQSVKRELEAQGFASSDINVFANEESDTVRKSSSSSASTSTQEAGSGIGGKISSFFRSMVGSEADDHDYYSAGVTRGGAVVAVNVADDKADAIQDFLESRGAMDAGEQNIEQESTTKNTPIGTASSKTARVGKNEVSIPIVEEELQIGKREVQRGGVRVYSHVTEHPVEADVRLREEHVRVERRPVDRPATEADFRPGQTIELIETAEQAVIGKTSRVVEEVVVGKNVTERQETVRDSVRRTEVEVENVRGTGASRSFSDYDSDFRTDFQKNYGTGRATYDEYAPAYQYGYTLGGDPRYSNDEWPTVESQAQTDWTSKGHGSWESFKGAVRTGWDRVRGQ